MPPLNFSSLADTIKRPSDSKKQREVYKKYAFVCEGEVTETLYFTALKEKKGLLGIHPRIEIYPIQKEGKDQHLSYPPTLFEKIKNKKEEIIADESFYSGIDKIIFVFDLDIYGHDEQTKERLDELLAQNDPDIILGVTNPNFELFLLLHQENSFENYILPNYDEILNNKWIGNGKHKKRPSNQYFQRAFHIDPKRSKNKEFFHQLILQLPIAIEQEKLINQDIDHWQGKLTSNIGKILNNIKNEKVYD